MSTTRTPRTKIEQDGRQLRTDLGLDGNVHHSPAAGYASLTDELVFGAIWSRPGLPRDERMMAVLCTLGALERTSLIQTYVAAALKLDISPLAIQELFVQASLYAGFSTSEVACSLAQEVFDAAGVRVEHNESPKVSAEELATLAGTKMVELHGDRATSGYAQPGNPTTGPLYDLAMNYGYGALWHREGLSRRQRFICTIASFTSLGLDTQVAKFAQSAENNDLSRSEIVEIVVKPLYFVLCNAPLQFLFGHAGIRLRSQRLGVAGQTFNRRPLVVVPEMGTDNGFPTMKERFTDRYHKRESRCLALNGHGLQ